MGFTATAPFLCCKYWRNVVVYGWKGDNMIITGYDKCYNCGNNIKWGTTPIVPVGSVIAYNVPENTAEAIAIDKNADGTVKFEITCQCKKCGVRNKYVVNK